MTFDEWLVGLFAQPTEPSTMAVDDSSDAAIPPSVPAAVWVDYVAQLFAAPAVLVERFSPEQANEGLWMIANHFSPVLDEWKLAPPDARVRVIDGIYTLYAELFGRVCTPCFGHLDCADVAGSGFVEVSPLNSICYMWWDLVDAQASFHGGGGAKTQARLLGVMSRTLRLDHVACREGALHGLGHWHRRAPDAVAAIIDDFLATTPDLSLALRRYALAAREGAVQ